MKGRKTLVSMVQEVGVQSHLLTLAAEKGKDTELKFLARDLRRWLHRARRHAGIEVKPALTGRARRLHDPER